MKFFFILVFFTGILLGYTGMAEIGMQFLPQGQVLSEFTENSGPEILRITYIPSQTPTATQTPTSSPTPSITPSPTPTPLLTATLTPTPVIIPSPIPTPVTLAPADLDPLFKEFSSAYGVDEGLLKKIADCESHFNPGAYNDPYAGMFQFSEGAWTKYRNMMGKDPNIDLRFGARESIETAAYVVSLNQAFIWPACSS